MSPRLVVLAALSLVATPSLAATWVVLPDGTGDFPTIQAAVDAASDGDEILLGDGVFTGPGNRDVDLLGKAITIRSGSGHPESCVVDNEGADASVFHFVQGEGPATEIADLTVARGGDDPAIRISASSPTLRRVLVRESAGSSIVCESSDVLLDGVEVRYGGMPVVQATGGAPTMTGCLLESNQGAFSSSASISLESTQSTIENCVIHSCGTTQHVGIGACIRISGGSATIRDCDITGNLDGALVVNDVASPVTLLLQGCVVEDNAYGVGLGTTGPGCTAEVLDCTIRENGSPGLATWGSSSVTAENCVVEGNAGGLQMWTDAPSIRNCLVRGNTGTGISIRSGTIEGCTVQGSDRGISVVGGIALVRDCLVTGNATGGVWVQHAGVTIDGCTIAANGSLSSSFGALAVTFTYGEVVTVRRSIVWGNCSSGEYDVYVSESATLDLDCSDVDPGRITGPGTIVLGGDVLAEDPRFCAPIDCAMAPTTEGEYTLAEGSPALSYPCGALGALGAGCTLTPVGANLQSASWGAIKSLYRE